MDYSQNKLVKEVDEVINKIKSLKDEAYEKRVIKQTLIGKLDEYINDLELANDEIMLLDKVSLFLKSMVDLRTQSAYTQIEETMNWCLSNVPLKQRYRMKIVESDNKRIGRGVSFVLVDLDTGKERSVKTQTGTALAQIVSFLLLVVVISVSGSSRILVTDEMFSGLEDEESIKNFSDILSALAINENFQIMIVEQNKDIAYNENIKRINLDILSYEEGLVQTNKE